jgi:diguanylate cyclase (GGDEF)-like protein
MQPGSITDVNRTVPSELLDGRDSLRLVKIRLALTLLAVAILPFAAVAPIARAVLDDSRTGLEQRLAAESEHAAAEVRRELAGISESMEQLAAADVTAAAVGLAAGDPATEPAAAQLRALIERPSSVVAGVAIADASGTFHVRVGDGAASVAGPPATNEAEMHLVPGGGGASALEIAVAIPGAIDGPSTGWIATSISLQGLLSWASPNAAAAGRSVEIVDADGQVLAMLGPDTGINLPGTVIDMAANGSEMSAGVAPLGLSQLDAWQVVARAPLPVTSIPFPAVAALGGLLGLLVGFILWMARQILRPAAELEAQHTRLHDLYQTARDAALRDSLTGLGNHRAFQEEVSRLVDQARRYGTPFSLILLDIDEFKRVNDTRGHATGDELLAEVGSLIRATVRQADAGYRIGGDEFAILLPRTDCDGAEFTARRLLSRGLEERRGGRYRAPISFSAGVTACPQFGMTRLELTAQADAALYRGKRAGRTVVSSFDPEIDREHVDDGMRSELSTAVAAVIDAGKLSAVYQPIVQLSTGQILGYEGLVRVGPETGFPHTGALFDAAEVAGRVLDLDRTALDSVLRGAGSVPVNTMISLNVSPRSFEVPEFNATVFLAIIRRHGVAPNRVLLELTERDAIRDPDRLRAAILELQAAGVRIAADDVGAGNAGLRLLSQFRFDVVKIDLSLVQGGAIDDQTLPVIASLVQLARQWGALTIAEGVETEAQLQMIRQLDIDAGQGYLLGRPGPILATDRVDLDALGAVAEAGPGPSLASLGITIGTRAAAKRVRGADATAARLGSASATAVLEAPPAPPPVLTAAAIIARGAPNPFARG